MSSSYKKPAAGGSREDAPLLADDAADDIESDGGEAANGEISNKEKAGAWFQKGWHWILNNLMVVAIVLLLLGGVVALCVYFAGMFHAAAGMWIKLRSYSNDEVRI